jgi:hypothetical protein
MEVVDMISDLVLLSEETNEFFDYVVPPKYRHGFLYSERIPDKKLHKLFKDKIKFHSEECKMFLKDTKEIGAKLCDAESKKVIVSEEVMPDSVGGEYLEILLLLNMYRTKDEVVMENLYSRYVRKQNLEERLEKMRFWHMTVLDLFRAKDDLGAYAILSKCGKQTRPMLDYMLVYLRRAESIADERLFYSDPLDCNYYPSINDYRDAYQRAIRVGINMIEAAAISQRIAISEYKGETPVMTKTKDSVLSSLKRDQPNLFPTK